MTALEVALVPAVLLAPTTQAYSTPFPNPNTVKGLASPLALQVSPAAVQLATYVDMADCPAYTGAKKPIMALAFPGLAAVIVGAQGRLPRSLHPASAIDPSAISPQKLRIVRGTHCTTNCPIKPASSWFTMWQWYM